MKDSWEIKKLDNAYEVRYGTRNVINKFLRSFDKRKIMNEAETRAPNRTNCITTKSFIQNN